MRNDFDRDFNNFQKIFKVMFIFVVLGILAVFAGQCYLVVRYGPKVLNTADKAIDKADKYLDN